MSVSDVFTAVYKGETREFKIISPRLNETREAQKIYNTVYNDALNSKAIIRLKLDQVMREQGLWGDEQQAKLLSLQKDIRNLEFRLKGKGMKLSEAKEISLKIIDLRNEMRNLLRDRSLMDSNTAEGQAENMQFNYLVSACTVYNDGKDTKVFNSLDEYLQCDDDDLTTKAAMKLMELRLGISSTDEDMPEYKFLKKYKFVDDKLRLINKDGKLIDRDGRLIDENGRFIDENGNFVDSEGRPVDEDGNYFESNGYFLDDDGNPIIEEEEKAKENEIVDELVEETE